jgi:general secretion pathway protein M
MIASLSNWWTALSSRERWLVGVAGGLAAIVIGWLVIALPLQSALSSSREAHGIAVDRHAAVLARVEALEALQARGAAQPAAATATLDLAITQSAAEQGFTLSRNEAQGTNSVVIAIANARAPALLRWLGDLEAAGIGAADLSLRPNADGTVALTATLRRAS